MSDLKPCVIGRLSSCKWSADSGYCYNCEAGRKVKALVDAAEAVIGNEACLCPSEKNCSMPALRAAIKAVKEGK